MAHNGPAMKTLPPLLLALALATPAAAGPVLERIQSSGRIVLATTLETAP